MSDTGCGHGRLSFCTECARDAELASLRSRLAEAERQRDEARAALAKALAAPALDEAQALAEIASVLAVLARHDRTQAARGMAALDSAKARAGRRAAACDEARELLRQIATDLDTLAESAGDDAAGLMRAASLLRRRAEETE